MKIKKHKKENQDNPRQKCTFFCNFYCNFFLVFVSKRFFSSKIQAVFLYSLCSFFVLKKNVYFCLQLYFQVVFKNAIQRKTSLCESQKKDWYYCFQPSSCYKMKGPKTNTACAWGCCRRSLYTLLKASSICGKTRKIRHTRIPQKEKSYFLACMCFCFALRVISSSICRRVEV